MINDSTDTSIRFYRGISWDYEDEEEIKTIYPH